MGYITNVIIVLDGVRPDLPKELSSKLKQWFYDIEDSADTEFEIVETPGKGSKAFSPVLLIGAFNYLNVEGLINFLFGIDWLAYDGPAMVEILYCQEADSFTHVKIYSSGAYGTNPFAKS